jgi:hypothetical protein
MSKEDFLTFHLNPDADAGHNQFSATSNRDWIEAEQARIRSAGGSCYIVTDTRGWLALSKSPQSSEIAQEGLS